MKACWINEWIACLLLLEMVLADFHNNLMKQTQYLSSFHRGENGQPEHSNSLPNATLTTQLSHANATLTTQLSHANATLTSQLSYANGLAASHLPQVWYFPPFYWRKCWWEIHWLRSWWYPKAAQNKSHFWLFFPVVPEDLSQWLSSSYFKLLILFLLFILQGYYTKGLREYWHSQK